MKLLGIEPVAIDCIEVPERLRAIDDDWVGALALSIEQTGLQQPIQVAAPARRNGRYRLLAGAHRLEACRRRGQTEILARILEVSRLEARLVEIDENLIRWELNALDRAAFLAERKAVWDEIYPDNRGGDRKSAEYLAKIKNEKDSFWSFPRATAEKIGLSERSIQMAVRIHARLAPMIRTRLRNTRLAGKQGELLALARLDPDRQARVLDLVLAAESPARSVAAAAKLLDGTRALPEADRQLQRLLDTWNRAGGKARAGFLKHLHEIDVLDRPAAGGRYSVKEVAA